MGTYQVTQEEWEDVMGADENYSEFPAPGDLYESQWREFPVDTINWHEAVLYCNLRSMKEGLSPVYSVYKSGAPNADNLQFNGNDPYWEVNNWTDIPANWSTDPADWGSTPYNNTYASRRWALARMVEGADGYRLPTEAEWEYACRAGANPKTPWNTGASITTVQANFDSSVSQPVPVKMYAPNAWGLYDMHGNVSEWVWDWHGEYLTGPLTDPQSGMSGWLAKRLRGGSFAYADTDLRSASRDMQAPYSPATVAGGNLYSIYGFRVVRYIKQSDLNPAPAPKTVIDARSGAASVREAKVLPNFSIVPEITVPEITPMGAIFRGE
jgi:formylglycine-generating enzyme required for sulfatase activity